MSRQPSLQAPAFAHRTLSAEGPEEEGEDFLEESVIRVGNGYQALVPKHQPCEEEEDALVACVGELLHAGVLFDRSGPGRLDPSPLATSRGSRDVARKPTPGAKQRRASADGGSPNGSGAAGGAASSPLLSEEYMGAPGGLPFRGFAFPLPASGGSGCQDAGQERSLGWQLVKLGWSPKRLVPPELLEQPRREWSAAERKAFTKGLSSQGKHFRELLQKLPGRSVDELVERYYATKTHKRMAQVNAEQATRNVRVGPCGTMGCLLHDNHAGPHQFSAPMGPRVRKPKIKGDNE